MADLGAMVITNNFKKCHARFTCSRFDTYVHDGHSIRKLTSSRLNMLIQLQKKFRRIHRISN